MSIQRRLGRARLDQQTTLEEFDFAASPKLPTAQIRDLAALRWLYSGKSVILHGPVGVGRPTSRKPSGSSSKPIPRMLGCDESRLFDRREDDRSPGTLVPGVARTGTERRGVPSLGD
jgi:hypothetical protein